MKDILKELKKSAIDENPIFVLALSLCPVLAVSNSVKNSLFMGLAFIFVLVLTNTSVSLLRQVISDSVRIPVYMIIITTLVTVVQYVMAGFFVGIDNAIGVYVSLIAINCLVFGRAEVFASKNKPLKSALDGLFAGIGVLLSLFLISFIRELLGFGRIFGRIFYTNFKPAEIMHLAPGGFLIIGLIIAFKNYFKGNKFKREVK